jgi:hypothetical protein
MLPQLIGKIIATKLLADGITFNADFCNSLTGSVGAHLHVDGKTKVVMEITLSLLYVCSDIVPTVTKPSLQNRADVKL